MWFSINDNLPLRFALKWHLLDGPNFNYIYDILTNKVLVEDLLRLTIPLKSFVFAFVLCNWTLKLYV